MSRATETARLARLPLLRGVAPERLEAAAQHARWVRAAPGRTIIDYKDPSDDVYLILAGTVRVAVHSVAGQEVILGDLGAGEIFGEMAAIDGAARSANVTAVHNAELCALPRQAFLDLVLGDPAAGLALLRPLPASWGLLLPLGFALAGLAHGAAYAESIAGAPTATIIAYLLALSAMQAGLALAGAQLLRSLATRVAAPRLVAGGAVAAVGALTLVQALAG